MISLLMKILGLKPKLLKETTLPCGCTFSTYKYRGSIVGIVKPCDGSDIVRETPSTT